MLFVSICSKNKRNKWTLGLKQSTMTDTRATQGLLSMGMGDNWTQVEDIGTMERRTAGRGNVKRHKEDTELSL